MHKEARGKVMVRLKLVVLDLSELFGSPKPARNTTSGVPAFIVGTRNTRKQDSPDYIEKDLWPLIVPTEHLPKSCINPRTAQGVSIRSSTD
jgi:hypothetical protein